MNFVSAKSDVSKLEAGVANKWRWEWTEKVIDGVKADVFIKKIERAGEYLYNVMYCTKNLGNSI